MGELLDNQIDTQNENLKIKIPGFTQALVEVAMKIKKVEKMTATQKNLMKGFYKTVSEDWRDQFQ